MYSSQVKLSRDPKCQRKRQGKRKRLKRWPKDKKTSGAFCYKVSIFKFYTISSNLRINLTVWLYTDFLQVFGSRTCDSFLQHSDGV